MQRNNAWSYCAGKTAHIMDMKSDQGKKAALNGN